MSSFASNKSLLEIARELGNYSPGGSGNQVLEALSKLDLEEAEVQGLIQAKNHEETPSSFPGVAGFMRLVQQNRQQTNQAYEEAMARYSTVNSMTAKRKPTEDEAKLKQTLTDYILKVESVFEKNDLMDESLLKELNRFITGLDSSELLSENNISSLMLSPKVSSAIQPFFKKLAECYDEYSKIHPVLNRLIRISNYVIEDAGK
ncbi:hypothetical protein CH373_15965 [Leptospira perolatii]|uniref:Uncharacterized protein n=1 Tax=Leptospira perolatii TaxID=2023191 RepID=A0A2M9ZJ97_9LEPT|nr:hypothetical protein [Leptospira perolatii]PJZ68196.1 hypothetical protein CH360_17535 [Leptospira perolatii]PJZ72091.1 hypothetical protein CH373_15965 [Leptospira perolatii]